MSTAQHNERQSKRERQKSARAERLAREAKAAKAQRARSRVLLAAAAVFAVALIGGLTIFLAQGADRTLGLSAATAEGAVPPVLTQDGTTESGVGMDAPVASGPSPDGGEVTIGAGGEPEVVLFLAHWCPHCQDEVPVVVEWVEQGVIGDGVRLIGVSSRHDPARPNWPPDEWLEREAWPGEILVDHDDSVADAWGLQGTPMWTFVDADGIIQARYAGTITQAQLEEGLAAVGA